MIFGVVFLPLLAVCAVLFFSRFIGSKGVVFITTGSTFFSFLLSSLLFYKVSLGYVIHMDLLPWIGVGVLDVNWGFLVDPITVVMLIVVTSISFVVHLYSIEYMSADPHLPRFMMYLSFFTFTMLMLVTSNNFLQMFFGWEGVGMASYLLINFWHTRIQANKSAMKAIIMNRIGDFGLSLAIFLIFFVCKSLDFSVVFSLTSTLSHLEIPFLGFHLHVLSLISILLFVGSVGKSAQLGLHTWLPDAMEGPTPVSALIHAATMVTAGVFLLVRCSPIVEYSPFALSLIMIVGGSTALFAATVALVQNDIKRVVAYSTCSQLGYMIFTCGMSSYHVSMFHLANHAFFKALLFLGAGSVIHAMSNEQDMRKMGGLAKILPFTYSIMIIGSISLMGFPFLSGFYSKDLILEVAFTNFTFQGTFAYSVGILTAFLTAFYSTRLLYLTFITSTNVSKSSISTIHEPNLFISSSLILLSFGSIFFGYCFKDLFIGVGTDFWGHSIFIHPTHFLTEFEFLSPFIKNLPFLFGICASSLSLYLYHFHKSFLRDFSLSNTPLYHFLSKKWYFDLVYNTVVRTFLSFGYKVTFFTIDRGFLDYFGPTGITHFVQRVSNSISNLQSGYIYHYLMLMFLGIVLFISLLFVGYPSIVVIVAVALVVLR